MTAIIGPPQTTAAQAVAWAQAQGATAIAEIVAPAYWQLGPSRGGVRADVAFCQFCKETGFGRFAGTDPVFSATATMHNCAGLKNAAGTATASFPDWWTGVTAHLDHLALYAGAVGYPRIDTPDQRHFPSLCGECPTVEALGGHWAPNPSYGSSIVADYLDPLLTLGGPPVTMCPFARWEPGPGHGGPFSSVGLVLHVNAGTGDPGPYFTQTQSASSHWQVMYTGELIQYIDADAESWAQMAGNSTYHSVETEGYPSEPLNQAQLDTLARLYAWGHQTYGWDLAVTDTPGQRGFIGHGDGGAAWGGHYGCPGDLRKAQRQQILDDAGTVLGQGTTIGTKPVPAAAPPWVVTPVGAPTVLQHFTDKEAGPMQTVFVPMPLDAQGDGWLETSYPFARFVAATHQGPDPAADKTYWDGVVHVQNRDNNILVSLTGCKTREGAVMHTSGLYLTLAE